jgi:hypothetical protein
VYGLLLGATGGVPYVTDGNESFSMLIHASNLYHFPLSQTFGLTDEAMSPDPAAHPYVYTHQGNFPRVFSFVLYVLGARSVESQIVITTFTVGLLSLFLIYHFFTTISSTGSPWRRVGVPDRLPAVRWQVNTYRVWHGLFFLALLCVHGGGPTPNVGACDVRGFACSTSSWCSAYVAILTGLYWCPLRSRRDFSCRAGVCRPRRSYLFLLVGQLISYLG